MRSELNKALGERIRLSREAANLTQDELARRLDMSTNHISALERGHNGPSLETLVNISSTLGVSCDFLLTGKSNNTSSILIDKINNLSPDYLEMLENQVSSLLNIQNKNQ